MKEKPTHCLNGHEFAVTGKFGNGRCRECYNICPKGHDKRITGWTKNHRCRKCLNARTNKWNRAKYRELKNGVIRVYHRGKDRIRDSEIVHTYGHYDLLFQEQKGLCAICKKPETAIHSRTSQPFELSVDHDHTTQFLRGLLCNRCNRAIGWFDDNPDLVLNAYDYLLTWKTKHADFLRNGVFNYSPNC